MNTKVKNVLNVFLDIIIVLFLVFSTAVLVIALTQKTGNVSRIFGYTINSVQTESMEAYNEDGSKADGAIFKGDIIISKLSDEDHYEVGQTVMFYMNVIKNDDGTFTEATNEQLFSTPILVTHNIIEVVEVDGVEMYRTKGINNVLEDKNLKTADEIVAVYTGTRLGGIGKAIDFVQSPLGFLICIILPIGIFVIIQTIRVIRNFIAYKGQKAAVAAASGELTEEQKRLIAEEYLKQQKAAEDDATSSTVESTADGE